MTFYWWSHWFWITLLSNLIFPLTVIVHTYPSQGSIQEYNQNQEDNTKKLVTKLYQSSNVLAWTTDMPTSTKNTTTVDKLKLENVVQVHKVTNLENSTKDSDPLINNNEEEEYYYDADTTDDVTEKLNLEQMEVEMERKGENLFSSNKSIEENDVKRSAEDTNKENFDKSVIELLTTSTLASLEKRNNYTNFTDKTTSINMTATNNTSNSSDNTLITNISTQTSTIPIVGITNTTTIQLSQAPATPKIVKAQTDNLDWLNRIANHLPPAHITTNVTQNYPEDQHKMPFTLENVNKPEDLRREESEHRSRKSKGLSAEYKVNRYINYSSESKNLLTRSASTTVNEYDSEESNISSEALSVQRAYFMDVGAISAICFTVFGICCTVGTIGLVLYRRRFLNKPQALSEPDSSVYIDDSTMRVSDNSDEMYSLDNDSFLNSLEAMTIQNYWTDTVKHTKL